MPSSAITTIRQAARRSAAQPILVGNPRPLPAAMATKRLTVMAAGIATRIVTNETGERAIGVEVMDAKTRQKRTYLAKIMFVCASALEGVRLLLLSANEKYPKGLSKFERPVREIRHGSPAFRLRGRDNVRSTNAVHHRRPARCLLDVAF